MTTARKVEDVHTIFVTLEVNAKPSLFILVSADRSINRSGSGTLENNNPDLFIAVTPDTAIFERVRSHLTETTLQRLGRGFKGLDVRGVPCKLTLMFQFNDGTGGRYECHYGSESQGPHSDVVDFVRGAVHETEGWYQEQLKMVKTSG